ncbi:MAG: NAD(P)/FAD-dependent oxidoreductase, partial [Hyphomicrobium sp.]
RKVLLLEHTDKAGAKILISGGGRCNFTNLDCGPKRYISANPHFCTSALSRYTQTDFMALVQRHGIAFHEKTLGQLFCDGSARAVVAMLLAECAAGGVGLRAGVEASAITKPDDFRVETNAGAFTAPSLVLATGGLSIPKMGATGFAYDIARHFGLGLVETRPGLVPFKAAADASKFDASRSPALLDASRSPALLDASLAGVSAEAIVTLDKTQFRENILFTHRGLSGPAILQISSYWKPGDTLSIDLLPGIDAAALLIDRKRTRPKALAQTILADVLPQRLAQAWAPHLPQGEMANIPGRDLLATAAALKSWTFTPGGTEGYAKAEVTVGGIDTRDLSSKTMEARAVPGLYCIGEAVDVTGWLGGYNFQWAWSSGWVAGQAV